MASASKKATKKPPKKAAKKATKIAPETVNNDAQGAAQAVVHPEATPVGNESLELQGTPAIQDPPPVVQDPPVKAGGPSTDPTPAPTALAVVKKAEAWEWTKSKRKALTMTMEGHPVGKIADVLGKHRNTIRNWWNTPEFQAEVRTRMTEATSSMRLRQAHRAGIMGEALFAKSTRLMQEALTEGGKLDIGASQLVLRELRDWQREEREILGDNVQRIEQRVFIDGQMRHDHGTDSASGRSFKEFLAEHIPNVTALQHLPENATPQEAMIEVVAEVLQETEILELIAAEDKIEDAARAEQEASMKRKR